MTELARHSTEYGVVEHEPSEILAANLRVGSHLWSSATVFFFVPFLFAYFYLRALDGHKGFQPKGVSPSVTLGTLIAAAIVAAAVLIRLGLIDQRARRRAAWRLKGAAAAVLLVAACVLQVVAWWTQGFGPADGGYASVYFGWTAMQVLFVIGLAYWVETSVAISFRYRESSVAAGEASGDPGRPGHDVEDPLSLIHHGIAALSFFGFSIAVLSTVAWIVLYLL